PSRKRERPNLASNSTLIRHIVCIRFYRHFVDRGETIERNHFSPAGSTAGAADAVGTFGNAGNNPSTGGTSASGSETGGLADRARDMAGVAKEKLADVGSMTRDRAGNLKNSLADALESSAEKLRQRAGGQGGQ